MLLALVIAAATAAESPQAIVEKLLADQQAAWNRGDLEGYMAGYWRSPELTFYSGASVTRGWQPTLDRYRKRYQGEGREMGALTFSDLEVEPLSDGVALARGKWALSFKTGKGAHGVFTLLVKKLPELVDRVDWARGWRIVHDHSSGG
jgi:beta-aspartyl-peptidase (threonine type)